MSAKGRFIVIDGIAGSGKSTLLKSAKERALTKQRSTFDLRDWPGDTPPTLDDVKAAEVLFTYEPTRRWVGAAIRQELSRVDTPYSGRSLAHAFALDREIMYRRLILPALEAGKIVVQDRSVTSSIAYQPIMPDSPSLEELLTLPGNALALAHAPHVLLLTDIEPERVAERICGRDEESKGVFADIPFLTRVHERFHAPWFHDLFKQHGTEIQLIDTRDSMEATFAKIQPFFDSLFTR